MLLTEIKTVVQLYSESFFDAVETWTHYERPEVVENRIILVETAANLLRHHGHSDEAYQFCLVGQVNRQPISSNVLLAEVTPTCGTQLVENGDSRTLALIEDQTESNQFELANLFFQNVLMIGLACGHGADVSVQSGQNQRAITEVLRQIFRLTESAGLVSIAEYCPASSTAPRFVDTPKIRTVAGGALYRHLTAQPLSQASNNNNSSSNSNSREARAQEHPHGDLPASGEKRTHGTDADQKDKTPIVTDPTLGDGAAAPGVISHAADTPPGSAWNLMQPIMVPIPFIFAFNAMSAATATTLTQAPMSPAISCSRTYATVTPTAPSTAPPVERASEVPRSSALLQAEAPALNNEEPKPAAEVSEAPPMRCEQDRVPALEVLATAATAMLPVSQPTPDRDAEGGPCISSTDTPIEPPTSCATVSQSSKKTKPRKPAHGTKRAKQQKSLRKPKGTTTAAPFESAEDMVGDETHYSVGMRVAWQARVEGTQRTYTGRVVAFRERRGADGTVEQTHVISWDIPHATAASDLQLPGTLTVKELAYASGLALQQRDGWTTEHPSIGTLVADAFQDRHDGCATEPGKYLGADGQVAYIVLSSVIVLYVGKVARYLPSSAELSGQVGGDGAVPRDNQLYHIVWSDGDVEDFDEAELNRARKRYKKYVCEK